MNTSLFKSKWALIGAVIAIGFLAWPAVSGAEPGARAGSDPGLVLWSGWVTMGLMVVVCAYSLRKFVHKLGISPEMRWKVPQASLERCESRINELRASITAGLITSRDEAQEVAERILKEEGVKRICRARVVETMAAPPLTISLRPTQPLGRMALWLHFHVYLGLASAVVLFVHGGASLASPMGIALNLLSALVIVTGVLGTILFAVGPAMMTRRERDLGFEEAAVKERSLNAKLKGALAGLEPDQARLMRSAGRSATRPERAREALRAAVALAPNAEEELQDVMVLLAQRQHVLGELSALKRIRSWMNLWRVVHVPSSLVLLALSFVHVYQIWRW